jgi:hypothetical protein
VPAGWIVTCCTAVSHEPVGPHELITCATVFLTLTVFILPLTFFFTFTVTTFGTEMVIG